MQNKLQIALDYDETYSADRELWDLFIYAARSKGHEVTFCTYRDSRWIRENEDIESDADRMGMEIVYTGGKQKMHVFKADIWIDDDPSTIVDHVTLGNMYDGCLVNNDLGPKLD